MLLTGLVIGTLVVRAPGPRGLDVETEDDAVAALSLYLAEVRALEGDADAEAVRRALDDARPRFDADGAARAYWGSRDHDRFVAALEAGRAPDPQPPALRYLEIYLRRLPPETLRALRGHPVAGPALRHLR